MSHPISPEGYEKLKAEWANLWYEVRPKLLEEIAAAAAQGDRSENAEYIYGRKKLREIDRRLRELDGKITRATVVSGPRRDDRIYLGARVTLQRKGGVEMVVRLVGDDEIDPTAGCISRNSPLGAALMGREPSGTVSVQTPRGLQEYVIVAVEYLA
jgi:transcription elongation factor GreB